MNVFILPFRTVLIANYIKTLSKEISPTFSSSDLAKIKKFSRSKSIVSELMAFNFGCILKYIQNIQFRDLAEFEGTRQADLERDYFGVGDDHLIHCIVFVMCEVCEHYFLL